MPLQRSLGQLGSEGGPGVLAHQVAKTVGIYMVAQVIAIALTEVEIAYAADEGGRLFARALFKAGGRVVQGDASAGIEVLQGCLEPAMAVAITPHPSLVDLGQHLVREPALQGLLQQRAAEGLDALHRRQRLAQAAHRGMALPDALLEQLALGRGRLREPGRHARVDEGQMRGQGGWVIVVAPFSGSTEANDPGPCGRAT